MATIGTEPEQVKAALKQRDVTYADVARLARVSWMMVWYVVNGRKKSRFVTAAIHKLLGEDEPHHADARPLRRAKSRNHRPPTARAADLSHVKVGASR